MDIETEIFGPVTKRIIERSESLRYIKRFEKCGFEGWLKVEAAAALDEKLAALQNRGPDLLLKENLQIELKAATDLNPEWIIKEGALKHNCPCLFIGDGQQRGIDRLRADTRVTLLSHKLFSDGRNTWVIGIVMPN